MHSKRFALEILGYGLPFNFPDAAQMLNLNFYCFCFLTLIPDPGFLSPGSCILYPDPRLLSLVSYPMNNKHLIIFVKNRIEGKVKTRLAAGIGQEKALEVYGKLLEHTHLSTRCIDSEKTVYFSEYIEEDGLWTDGNFKLAEQTGPELGERMLQAFENQFSKGAERVCIIGSDTFEITPEIIRTAFNILKYKEVVIGPARDGGYYLLGMKELQPELFRHKSWGTDSVLSQTLEDLERLQLNYALLPELNDIDRKEDWLEHQRKNLTGL